MPSLATRLFRVATLPAQVAGRLPELIDAVIELPDAMDRGAREVRHTRQELEEAEARLDRLIQLSEVAIDEMESAVAQMRDGNARLEELTPLAETAVRDMGEGIDALEEALARLRELSSAADDVPTVDTDTGTDTGTA